MRKLIVILDPAHGADVFGKCSPDGTHKEYRWSRQRVANLKTLLMHEGFEVYETTTSQNEPGLTRRKNYANQIRRGQRKFLLSLHNNAKGKDGKWHDASGVAVYTTKGVTKSDRCAKILLDQFSKDFPELRIRKYSVAELDGDFEENFTVLTGSDYMACLIEWLFQDNMADVERLKDVEFNSRLEASLVKAIVGIDNYFSK